MPSGRIAVGGTQLEYGGAQSHLVPAPEHAPGAAAAVDEGAVGTAQVLQEPVLMDRREASVVTGDRLLGQDYVVVQGAA